MARTTAWCPSRSKDWHPGQPSSSAIRSQPAHAARVRARAVDGSWERTWDEIDNPYQQLLRDLGVHRTVNAALRWHDLIIGDIGLGTCSIESAVSLQDRLSTVEEFAVVASALARPGHRRARPR